MIDTSNFIFSSLDEFISRTHLSNKSFTRFHIFNTIFRFCSFYQVLFAKVNVLNLGCRIDYNRWKWGQNFCLDLLHRFFYRSNFLFFLDHLSKIFLLFVNRIYFQSFNNFLFLNCLVITSHLLFLLIDIKFLCLIDFGFFMTLK